jgi:preprotein translocase subunit YajC
MMDWLPVLAQTTTAPIGPSGPGGPPPSGTDVFFRQLLPIILIVGVFWWVMTRGRSKERKRYEQMLGALKKNDRVQTIGGIIGTVVDVRDNDVLVKVDEASNTKIRFNRTAIKEVLAETPTETK